ncbi:MAG TPA: ankyrin repeat domain-containing protein [Vicinamibacterales bacterium]|nr:ankyrin repeat domain-containing protein [Vicinamibacterales bacterium]
MLITVTMAALLAGVPLIEAVKAGDTEAVRALVAARADVNVAEVDGTTALHWAVHFDNLAAADLLIRAGGNVGAPNRYGVTPLWLACINGNEAMVEKLLAAGADPNTTMREGDTALMTAARTGTVGAVKALLRGGADVNARENWKGQTALMWAAAGNNVAAVEALIEAGADVQARTKYAPRPQARTGGIGREAERNSDVTKQAGFTALHFAVRAGSADVVKVLLGTGATVHDGTSDGTGVLVLAIASTHYELAAFLLQQGADPNAAGQGWTPLHQIAYTRRPNTGVNNPGLVPKDRLDSLTLATQLLTRGANPNRQATRNPDTVNVGRKRLTEVGSTSFWVAAQTLDLPLMRLLVEHGANPLLPNSTGDTPLLAASGLVIEKPGESPGTPEEVAAAIKFCLDHGADATTIDDEGNTALHGVAIWGSNAAVEMLVAAGARLDVKNKKGQTPWRIAEGAVFEDAVLAQPQTAALLRRLMQERGLTVE